MKVKPLLGKVEKINLSVLIYLTDSVKIISGPILVFTTVGSSDALGIEDYRKKSCIPIQYIETISHLILMRQKRWIYSSFMQLEKLSEKSRAISDLLFNRHARSFRDTLEARYNKIYVKKCVTHVLLLFGIRSEALSRQ